MRTLFPFVLAAAVICGVCWFALRDPGRAIAVSKEAARPERDQQPGVVPLETPWARADSERTQDQGAAQVDEERPKIAEPAAPELEDDQPPPGVRIPIVIKTRDGRSFHALAGDRGVEPKNLFVHAFLVAASHEPILAGAPLPGTENELARFHPPPEYQQVSLPGSVAGELELSASPPFWVGLWIHGVFFESRVLQAHDERVVFEIDAQALDASLATVTALLVDKESGDPVTDAAATLKADTSAHRRPDLSKVPPDDEGRIVFRRVIPGRHDLSILRGGNIVQRRLELAPGQELDLGRIPVRSGPGLEIRVVDTQGEGVQAWIEIAPLEKGAYVHNLYPPNLHRQTNDGGVYVLPVPDRVSVVRARPMATDGHYSTYSEIGTRNVLLDPEAVPPELVLLAQDPVHLRVEPLTTWVPGQRLTFEDEHGLIVDQAGGERNGKLDAELIPGPFVVRRWDGEREVGSLDVTVAAGDEVVRSP